MGMVDIRDELNKMEEKARLADIKWKESQQEYKSKHKKDLTNLEIMVSHFRQAKPIDYAKWLKKYIENGGKVTNFYSYNMHVDRFYVAKSDFKMFPLYGATSMDVIVPVGINVTSASDTGHNNIYFQDIDKKPIGFHGSVTVPCYSDVKELILNM